jgi:hypothetical protein
MSSQAGSSSKWLNFHCAINPCAAMRPLHAG